MKIFKFHLFFLLALSVSFISLAQTENSFYNGIENDLSRLESKLGYSLSSDQILKLGAMLFAESESPEERQQGIEFIRKAAQMGNGEAQYGIGRAYLEGEGVDQNSDKAFRWIEKSAKNEFLDAQFNIAHMLYNGIGTEIDKKSAINWYRVAADKGHVDAQFNLGNIYGQKLKKELARKYLRMAAVNGKAEAQRNLALQFATLPSSIENTKRAIMWIFVANYNGLDVDDVTSALGSSLNPSDEQLRSAIDAGLTCVESDYKSCL